MEGRKFFAVYAVDEKGEKIPERKPKVKINAQKARTIEDHREEFKDFLTETA